MRGYAFYWYCQLLLTRMFVDMLFILKAPAHAKLPSGSRSWVVHFLLSRVRPFRKYVQINGK